MTHGDTRCPEDLAAIGAVDWVIDAAANASVLAGLEDAGSRGLVNSNLMGTINQLEHCKQHQAGFILLSTSRVYSVPPLAELAVQEAGGAYGPVADRCPSHVSSQGISEEFSTAAPVSLYGASKLASEVMALEYHHAFEFPVWINRCGVMAGAGQFGKADQGIFSFWLHSWKEGRPLKYIGFDGTGYQVRDCLHPRDLASLVVQQCRSGSDQPRIVNVSGGAGSAISLRQLSDWCGQRWGTHEVVASQGVRPYDLPWIVLDSRLAGECWDWSPQMATDQILEEIAQFADTQDDWIGFSAT